MCRRWACEIRVEWQHVVTASRFMALVPLQGRNSEAMSLYKLISRHSAPHVAKSAKRLLFGFTAGDYLKTQSITYIPATGLA